MIFMCTNVRCGFEGHAHQPAALAATLLVRQKNPASLLSLARQGIADALMLAWAAERAIARRKAN